MRLILHHGELTPQEQQPPLLVGTTSEQVEITQAFASAGKGTAAKTNNTDITVGGYKYETGTAYSDHGIRVTLDSASDKCTVAFAKNS